jgi:NIMA (never in mitosis gene a)-related kinase
MAEVERKRNVAAKIGWNDLAVVRQLGKGSYGRAILCRWINAPDSEPWVVVKEILTAGLSPKEQRDAYQETKILASLHHPNIVGFRGSFVEDKTINIVMEYADAGDLGVHIRAAADRRQSFSEEQILDWFVQVCLGMKHVHDRKILHRDIKATNVFLTESGVVKIGDFGIARVLARTCELAKTAIGTPCT